MTNEKSKILKLRLWAALERGYCLFLVIRSAKLLKHVFVLKSSLLLLIASDLLLKSGNITEIFKDLVISLFLDIFPELQIKNQLIIKKVVLIKKI